MPLARRPSRCRCIGRPKDCPNSNLYLFAVHHTPDRWPFEHPVLECRVVLELSHRELAANTPHVEDEAIGIEHGVAIGEPFAFRQRSVDLLQVAVESPKAGVFERGEGRGSLSPSMMAKSRGLRGFRRRQTGGRARLGLLAIGGFPDFGGRILVPNRFRGLHLCSGEDHALISSSFIQLQPPRMSDRPKTDTERSACCDFLAWASLTLFGIAFSTRGSDEKISGVVYGFWG
jgi:hypothetical protein